MQNLSMGHGASSFLLAQQLDGSPKLESGDDSISD